MRCNDNDRSMIKIWNKCRVVNLYCCYLLWLLISGLLLHSCSLLHVFGRCLFSLASNSSRRENFFFRLTTSSPGLLALDLKFELRHSPGNTDPLSPPLGLHRSTAPTKLHVCVRRPRQSSPYRARGRRIVSGLHRAICARRKKGDMFMLHNLLKGAVLLAWEIRSAVRIHRSSLVYDYHRTGIF